MPSEYLALCEHPTDRPTKYKMQEGRRETLQLPAVQRERERERERRQQQRQRRRSVRAPIHTNNIGRNDIASGYRRRRAADAVRDGQIRQQLLA